METENQKVEKPTAEEVQPVQLRVGEERGPNEWFTLLQNFTDKLTLHRILTAFLTGMLITFISIIYENRNLIFSRVYSLTQNKFSVPTNWKISDKTKEELTKLVASSKLIKFIRISEVDLQKNRRVQRFWILQDPDEKSITEKADALLPQSMFDYDAKNTQQMVMVLNNEFVCSKFADTSLSRIIPELGKHTSTICTIAIPPFYGQFSGIMTVGLDYEPTKEEYDSLKFEISRIAVEIYLRDIAKKPL